MYKLRHSASFFKVAKPLLPQITLSRDTKSYNSCRVTALRELQNLVTSKWNKDHLPEICT